MESSNITSNKSYHNLMIFLAMVILLLGTSLRSFSANGSPSSGEEKLKSSMKLKLTNSEFSILIPRIKMEELEASTEFSNNELVFVSNENVGFYQLINKNWTKLSVKEVLLKVEGNLLMAQPRPNSFILTNAQPVGEVLLDYNHYLESNRHLIEEAANEASYAMD